MFIHLTFLLRLNTTSTSSGSSLVFSPYPYTVHIQARRPPSPLWFYAAALCILRWGGDPLSPLPPVPLDTPTLRLLLIFMSSSLSVVPLYGGIQSGT